MFSLFFTKFKTNFVHIFNSASYENLKYSIQHFFYFSVSTLNKHRPFEMQLTKNNLREEIFYSTFFTLLKDEPFFQHIRANSRNEKIVLENDCHKNGKCRV